jgi:hypothetical protein
MAIHVWISTGTSFIYQGNSWFFAPVGHYDANSVTWRVVSGDFDGDDNWDIAAKFNYGSHYANHVWLSAGTHFAFYISGWKDTDDDDFDISQLHE